MGPCCPATGQAAEVLQGIARQQPFHGRPEDIRQGEVDGAHGAMEVQPPEQFAARFQETDGDIRAVVGALLASREFRDSAGRKYKSPYRYVLSAVRATGVASSG